MPPPIDDSIPGADASVAEPWPDGGGPLDGAALDGALAVDAAQPTPVTFEIVNEGTNDLLFALDKGWQPVLFAYTGKPPKAKSIVMFAKHCTAACDADDPCPKCEAPEKAKDEKLLEQRVVIAPGKSHLIEWDGNVHVYEKITGGTKKKCECYRKVKVPAESYTLQSCGFRITKSAGERTKLQCMKQQVSLPPAKPTKLVFDFTQPTK